MKININHSVVYLLHRVRSFLHDETITPTITYNRKLCYTFYENGSTKRTKLQKLRTISKTQKIRANDVFERTHDNRMEK